MAMRITKATSSRAHVGVMVMLVFLRWPVWVWFTRANCKGGHRTHVFPRWNRRRDSDLWSVLQVWPVLPRRSVRLHSGDLPAPFLYGLFLRLAALREISPELRLERDDCLPDTP